jgi:transforming growth factor-beta-induced protein
MALDFAKRWALVSAIALALTGMVGCGDDDPPANSPDSGVTADASTSDASTADAAVLPSLVEVAAGNPDFSMLVAAATRAELVTTLSTGEFTIFAPTNAAFTASGITMEAINTMPVESLTGILTYHAVPGTVLSTDLVAGPATSVAMLSLIIGTEGGAKLNGGNTVTGGANVVMADILARNGVVHIIDRVLLPPTVADLARYAGLTSLAGAVEAAELDDDLAGEGPFTVFAPTNDAFDEIPVPSGEALANILLYHVVAANVPAAAVPAMASSLSENEYGDKLSLLFNTSSGVSINGNTDVVIANVFATNGIVHVIDKVLLPMNAVQAATAAGLTGLTGAVGAAADLPDGGVSVADALSAQAPYTIFAPTNAAFTAIESTIATLTADQIRDILLYHVLDTDEFDAPVLSTELPSGTTELSTLNGSNATLITTTTPPTIEGADIITTDIVVTNGVIHLIDAVILPPS